MHGKDRTAPSRTPDLCVTSLPAMQVAACPPRHARLADLVKQIWMVRGDRGAQTHQRIMPTGVVELIFSLADPQQFRCPERHTLRLTPTCVVNGFKSTAVDLHLAGHQDFFGVQLASYAPRLLFGIAASELTDKIVGGHDLHPGLAEVHAALMQAATFAARVVVIERYLLTQLDHAHASPWRMADATLLGARGGVAGAAAGVGLSERQFRRLWQQWHGISPEAFTQIERCVAALGAVHGSRRKLTDISADFGYWDQAHFIRHFRKVFGISPSDYRRHARPTDPPGQLVL